MENGSTSVMVEAIETAKFEVLLCAWQRMSQCAQERCPMFPPDRHLRLLSVVLFASIAHNDRKKRPKLSGNNQ